jgi:uncharacterized membrane protein YkvA (DUF1232 family)
MTWWEWLLVSLAAFVAVYGAFVLSLVALGRRSDARAFATFIPDCATLVSRLLRDPRVPRRRKLFLLALVGYLAMPFDIVPDFIPVAGQLDDAIMVAFVLRHLIRSGGEPLIRDLWPGPQQSLALVTGLAQPRKLRRQSSASRGRHPAFVSRLRNLGRLTSIC